MYVSGTEKLFADIFLEMIEHKSIEKISVKSLLEASGAAKQTFYNHFKDKNDLIAWIYINDASRIMEHYADSYDLKSCFEDAFQYFVDHKTFYMKAIKLEEENNLFKSIFDFMKEFYLKRIQTHCGENVINNEIRFMIEFTCYGEVNMCRKWLLEGMKLSTSEIADLMLKCMPHGLWPYLSDPDEL